MTVCLCKELHKSVLLACSFTTSWPVDSPHNWKWSLRDWGCSTFIIWVFCFFLTDWRDVSWKVNVFSILSRYRSFQASFWGKWEAVLPQTAENYIVLFMTSWTSLSKSCWCCCFSLLSLMGCLNEYHKIICILFSWFENMICRDSFTLACGPRVWENRHTHAQSLWQWKQMGQIWCQFGADCLLPH